MPTYTRFPRSNVTGVVPDRLDPGSPGFNWADQKVYVGDQNEDPILVGYPVRDWQADRAYRREDIVYRSRSLWRANADFIAPGPFNESLWIKLNETDQSQLRELSGTTLTQGEVMRATYDPADQSLVVPAGTGIIYPKFPSQNVLASQARVVEWEEARFPISQFTTSTIKSFGVSTAGTVVVIDAAQRTRSWMQQNIWLFDQAVSDDPVAQPGAFGFRSNNRQHQTQSDLLDLYRNVGSFMISGCDLSFSQVNRPIVSTGRIFGWRTAPVNSAIDPNIAPVNALAMIRASSAELTTSVAQASFNNTIDPGNYDVGGVVTPVPAGKFTVQLLFHVANASAVGTSMNIVAYGVTLFDTLDLGIEALQSELEAYQADWLTKEMCLMGAFVTNDDGSEQVAVRASLGPFPRFSDAAGPPGTSNFLKTDGTNAMVADLDLGSQGLINGAVDGANVLIIPRRSNTSGDISLTGTEGEVFVNTEDRAVWMRQGGASRLVASHPDVYDPARLYAVGQLTLFGNALYRCTTPVAVAEAFDPGKWQLIGSDPADPFAGALILDPPDAARNEIDLVQAGGVATAVKVLLDNTQSVDVAEFAPNTKIDRFGLPVGTFGEDVFRVSQASHGLQYVGQAIYLDATSGNWLPADDAAQDTFPSALVHAVIDANTFIAQVGGRINNLEPEAFAGGSPPVAGTYYYASADPGVLTSTPGPTPVPVLYATSATQGIVKLTGTVIPTVLTLPDIYPVGSIYISVDPTLPAAFTAGMTWEAYAAGRAIVGVGDNGESTWAVNDERGSETHTLVEAEMPAHDHNVAEQNVVSATGGAHTHNYEAWQLGGGGIASGGDRFPIQRATNADGNHNHAVTIPAQDTTSKGGGQPHNNVQPSIAVHMWKRIA